MGMDNIDLKIQEKLKHFTTVTLENVQSKCDKTLEQYKSELDARFESHKTEAVRLSSLEEKSLREDIERKASKEYTMEQLHIRRKISHKQDELKGKLFADVEKRLEEYRAGEAYKAYLVRLIKKAVRFARGEELHIYIDMEDEHLKDELEQCCEVTLLVSDHAFKGGIRAELPKRNILIDNTFETKLEEEKEKFLIVI